MCRLLSERLSLYCLLASGTTINSSLSRKSDRFDKLKLETDDENYLSVQEVTCQFESPPPDKLLYTDLLKKIVF